jgi:hypothetical protein
VGTIEATDKREAIEKAAKEFRARPDEADGRAAA